ncbi:membrane protein YczE [Arthrobacter sp. TMN-37]
MGHLSVLLRLLTSPNLLLRHLRLYLGLFLYGASIALMVRANLGASPWDVFGQGLARSTGLSFGIATVLISIGVLLLWIPIRQRPGWGTIANTILVGLAADVVLRLLATPEHLVLQGLMFTAGLVLLAVATALYIGAGMGPGPRDGLMTGLVRLTGWPVWTVRGSIELTVVVVGFLLGGVVGLGTVVFALAIGPLVQQALRTLRVPLRGNSCGKA